MLKRIASTGVNLVVLGVSVGIFLVAFIALNALGAAQKPPTISVLSATRDLNIGDVITAKDLGVTMPACISRARKGPGWLVGWWHNPSSVGSLFFDPQFWRRQQRAQDSRLSWPNSPIIACSPCPWMR